MRRKIQFKQSEILRAVKGAQSAGMEIARVEIEPETGRICLIMVGDGSEPKGELDKWINDHAG
jgi:hypothetical protein